MMMTPKPYYLFFDFDHTVYVDKQISDATRQALLRAQREGHKIILCTGRSQGHLAEIPVVSTIPWDGAIWGAADIFYNGICYEKAVTPDKDILAWHDYAKRHGYDLILEGQKELTGFLFASAKTPEETAFFHTVKDESASEDEAHLRTLLRINPVTKIMILSSDVDTADIPKTDMIPVIHPRYLEAYAPGCDKGNAIKRFCKHVGISIEQCVCFGDSMNDVPMFRVCPVSISMQWAPDALVSISTYQAKSKEGVAEGIQWLLGEENDRRSIEHRQ